VIIVQAITRMIAAGIAANAHLTIKVTILQNDISKSITVTFCICSIFSLSFGIERMSSPTVDISHRHHFSS